MAVSCTICNRPAHAPKQRIVGGKILEQCVARIHDAALTRPSNAYSFMLAAKASFRAAGVRREIGAPEWACSNCGSDCAGECAGFRNGSIRYA